MGLRDRIERAVPLGAIAESFRKRLLRLTASLKLLLQLEETISLRQIRHL
jgi:hypothetical protein